MTNPCPEISVIMSVYNAEKYINEAIDSILNQTFKNFEFIIINDGSTDNSLEIIMSYSDNRIKVINQQNTGLAIALNNGIKLSRGKYIARIDADDISLSNRLYLQYKFLENNPDYVIVGSNAEIINKEGNYIYSSKVILQDDEIKIKLPNSSFYSSSVLFSKDVAAKCGYYYEAISKLFQFEDAILWNNILRYGKGANLESVLIKYRLVPNAATTKSGKEGKIIGKILKEICRDNLLSEENREKLLKIKKKISPVEKERIYYFHLAKKFLFNNFQPKKSRKNVLKAIKIKPIKPMPYFLFIFSFFPKALIRYIYQRKMN